jgi:hypothetical protein
MSEVLEQAHNDVHGACGGDMNSLDYAAGDPVFWMHHNNIDRIWYRWQLQNEFAMYPSDARGPQQDSVGSVQGTTLIADLSGWMRNSPIQNTTVAKKDDSVVSTQDGNVTTVKRSRPKRRRKVWKPLQDDSDSIERIVDLQASVNGTSFNGTSFEMRNSSFETGNSTFEMENSSVELGNSSLPVPEIQMPIQIIKRLVSDKYHTWSEVPGYIPSARVVMVIRDVPSTRDPSRLDVYMKDQMIGSMYLLGMGSMGMHYVMDRQVDITIPHSTILAQCDTGQVTLFISFDLINLKNGQRQAPSYSLRYRQLMF